MPAPLVLIIEDTEDSRELLADLLGAQGYRTATAANGAEALTVVAATRPDLILLDLMMPVMDGATFRENQLKNPRLADIPVVVISAFTDAARLAASMRPKHTLPKPLDMNALLKVVLEVCPEHPAC